MGTQLQHGPWHRASGAAHAAAPARARRALAGPLHRAGRLAAVAVAAACASGCPLSGDGRPHGPLRAGVAEAEEVATGEGSAGQPAVQAPPAAVRGPVSIADLPDALGLSACGALEACLGRDALEQWTGHERSPHPHAAVLRAGRLHFLSEAIDAGHVLYDPAGIADCLQAIRGLRCGVLDHPLPPACAAVLVPNVALGDVCLSSLECEPGAYCGGAGEDECPRTCRERHGLGEACASDEGCEDGLSCRSGRCVERAVAAACDPEAGCAAGQVCIRAAGASEGTCLRPAAAQDDGDPCGADSACRSARCVAGLCAPPPTCPTPRAPL